MKVSGSGEIVGKGSGNRELSEPSPTARVSLCGGERLPQFPVAGKDSNSGEAERYYIAVYIAVYTGKALLGSVREPCRVHILRVLVCLYSTHISSASPSTQLFTTMLEGHAVYVLYTLV